MLSALAEILPLFVVSWLARRMCERVHSYHHGNYLVVAVARPDVLFKLNDEEGDNNWRL